MKRYYFRDCRQTISAGAPRRGRRRFSAVLAAVLVLAGAATLFAARSDSQQAVAANNAGVRAMKAGQIDEAIRQFQRAMAIDPGERTVVENLSGAFMTRGVEAEKAGRFDAAERDYRSAIALLPDDPDLVRALAVLHNNRATAAISNERLDEAHRAFAQAVQLLPRIEDKVAKADIRRNYARFLTLRAQRLEEADRIEEARAAYERALAYDPDNAVALASLGTIAYENNAYAAALEYYTRARKAAPPAREDLRAMLRERIRTLRKEVSIETDFVRFDDRYGRFDLFVPQSFPPATAAQVLDALAEARHNIGRDFDFATTRPFTAKVYARDQFESIHGPAGQVVGFYDGKLRLLDERLAAGRDDLRDLVFHEYTHSVVHRLGGDAVPSWLHEGLAQVQEPAGRVSHREIEFLRARVRDGRAPSLGTLTDPFHRSQTANDKDMPLIYLKSRMVVDFLLRKYDWPTMRDLLRETRRRGDFDEAFEFVFGKSVYSMEREWERWMMQ